MLLILVIMLMLFVIPCDPMPLSLIPWKKKKQINNSISNHKLKNIWIILLYIMLVAAVVLYMLIHFNHIIQVWSSEKSFTWKGKWSGPRAGAELIWTVPVSIASLIIIALLMSFVKTHPCNTAINLSDKLQGSFVHLVDQIYMFEHLVHWIIWWCYCCICIYSSSLCIKLLDSNIDEHFHCLFLIITLAVAKIIGLYKMFVHCFWSLNTSFLRFRR